MIRPISTLVIMLILGALQAMAQEHPPIIDMHLHAYPVGSHWPQGAPNPVTGLPSPDTDAALLRETQAALDRYNIVRAVINSCPMDLVLKWKEVNPDRIIASPYISGEEDCWPDIDDLREHHRDGNLGALGEFGLHLQGLTLSSPEAEPYLALAEELDVPVAVHMGPSLPGTVYKCCPEYRAALTNPLLIEQALVRHPDMRIYLMHAGYPYADETIALLHAHPQVYADLAIIDWVLPREEFHRYLHRLVQAGFPDRLMFGTDQLIWPDAIGKAIESIESAAFLSETQKRDIFYNNAARFLRLSDEEIARHHGR